MLDELGARERLEERHENGALAHAVDLVARRLLHLQDDVRLPVERRRVADDARACRLVGGVAVERALARPALDQNLDAALHQRRRRVGRQCNAVLVRRNFLGDGNPHHGLVALAKWPLER